MSLDPLPALTLFQATSNNHTISKHALLQAISIPSLLVCIPFVPLYLHLRVLVLEILILLRLTHDFSWRQCGMDILELECSQHLVK